MPKHAEIVRLINKYYYEHYKHLWEGEKNTMSDPASDHWYEEVYIPQQSRPLRRPTTTTWDVVRQDILSREEGGALKYGKYLTPNTDEDMLQHAYEEALDLVVYLKTMLLQRDRDKK